MVEEIRYSRNIVDFLDRSVEDPHEEEQDKVNTC